MKKRFLGNLGLLAVTIMWGGGFIASDAALTVLSPMQIMAVRFFLASIIMLFAALKHIHHITHREFISGAILGTCLFLAFIFQTVGLKFSTPAKNAFLTATNVLFVPLIVWGVYKRRPLLHEFIGMFFALIGTGLLTLENDFSIGFGEILSLICAFFFACQVFFTGRYTSYCRISVLNFIQMLTAFVLSVLLLPYFGGFSEIIWDTKALLPLLYLGIISTAVTYFLQTISQRYVKEVQAILILSLEAVFATIFSILLIHEQLSIRTICGSLLILSAVLISQMKLKKNKGCDMIKKWQQ